MAGAMRKADEEGGKSLSVASRCGVAIEKRDD